MTRIGRMFLAVAFMLAPLAFAPSSAEAAGEPAAPVAKTKAKSGKRGASKKASDAKAAKKAPRPPKGAVAAGLHPTNDNVQVTPFPSHADAARKALSQNRRDQLTDAERAARAEHQDDRWQTVLFNLRAFDARSDAEACFWRVLAYYRLGEMGRARSTRQLCTLAQKEEAVLDAEDALCGSVQPAAVMPEMLAAGEKPPEPVANPKPFGGAGPAKLER